eukprot:6189692-Pleurochrysis_carterae.AAC.1
MDGFEKLHTTVDGNRIRAGRMRYGRGSIIYNTQSRIAFCALDAFYAALAKLLFEWGFQFARSPVAAMTRNTELYKSNLCMGRRLVIRAGCSAL